MKSMHLGMDGGSKAPSSPERWCSDLRSNKEKYLVASTKRDMIEFEVRKLRSSNSWAT